MTRRWFTDFIRSLVPSLVLALMLALFAPLYTGQALVTDLSDKQIEIRHSFEGADLILFGAIGDTKVDPGTNDFDVVIVVRGPESPATVRRKEKIGPIWVNRQSITFPKAPGYYAVAATRPLSQIASAASFQEAAIGFSNLRLRANTGGNSTNLPAVYMAALDRIRTSNGLYRQEQDSVKIIGEGLFRTNVRLPANVPVGDFFVDAYVFQKGRQIAHNRISLNVDKQGFERAVFAFAHAYPLLYGFVAVFIALVAGWIAGVVGKK